MSRKSRPRTTAREVSISPPMLHEAYDSSIDFAALRHSHEHLHSQTRNNLFPSLRWYVMEAHSPPWWVDIPRRARTLTKLSFYPSLPSSMRKLQLARITEAAYFQCHTSIVLSHRGRSTYKYRKVLKISIGKCVLLRYVSREIIKHCPPIFWCSSTKEGYNLQ